MKIFISTIFAILFFSFTLPGTVKKTTETLIGFSMNDEKSEVTITVASNGCTGKTDFSFVIKTNTITVMRSKPDQCKRLTEAVSFTYTFKETGIDSHKQYKVLNPFTANVFGAMVH
jgi:hypothetical protein